ncbi:MAG: hypothetical protein GY820_09160 [Gammaproteobacteria bacterium]|nr:hypothetical protein [Gammaproteobacteria bacterium]
MLYLTYIIIGACLARFVDICEEAAVLFMLRGDFFESALALRRIRLCCLFFCTVGVVCSIWGERNPPKRKLDEIHLKNAVVQLLEAPLSVFECCFRSLKSEVQQSQNS